NADCENYGCENQCSGLYGNGFAQDDSRCCHQRQPDKWLTRRTEQLHLSPVFAYCAFAVQAAIVTMRSAGVVATRLWRRRRQPPGALLTRRCAILSGSVFCSVQDLFEEAQELEGANTAA